MISVCKYIVLFRLLYILSGKEVFTIKKALKSTSLKATKCMWRVEELAASASQYEIHVMRTSPKV
jgi:sulfur relay (sulfurtransferase) DsrF/TusC family protein